MIKYYSKYHHKKYVVGELFYTNIHSLGQNDFVYINNRDILRKRNFINVRIAEISPYARKKCAISVLKNYNLSEVFDEIIVEKSKWKNFNCISKICNLKKLSIHFSNVENISFVKNLKNLNTLSLERNRIYDISYLKNLRKLKHLNLASNHIADFSVLQYLKNLEFLNVRYNCYSSDYNILQYTKGLTKLKKIITSEHGYIIKNDKCLTYW